MKKKTSFEDRIERIESIINEFEEADLPLDESVKLYEEGLRLIQECSEQLSSAEQRVKILTVGETGELSETTFKESEDA